MHPSIPACIASLPGSRRAALRAFGALLLAAVAVVAGPSVSRASDSGADERSSVESEIEGNATFESAAPAGEYPMRKSAGFSMDAAVTRGWWAELGQRYESTSSFWTTARLAYGWRSWEFGGEIDPQSSAGFDVDDFGLWAKYAGWKVGAATVGAGARIDIPVEFDDADFAPFGTMSLPVEEWDLRASLGYVIPRHFVYNAACLRPLGERADFRAEMFGEFDDTFGWGNVRMLPGVDIHFVRGAWRISTRLSAGMEVHPDTRAIVALSFVLSEI